MYDSVYNIYCFVYFYILIPLYIISLIWVGHVARMEEGRSAFKILTGIPTGKRPLGIGERTILEWTLRK